MPTSLPKSRTGCRLRCVIAVLLTTTTSFPAGAQVSDTSRARPDSSLARREAEKVLEHAHAIRWYEAAAVVGGAALLSTLDQPVHRTVQQHRSPFLGDVAAVFRQEGEPEYYATVSLGVFGAGLVANSPELRRAGRRLVAAVLLSYLASEGTKRLVGRSRPNEDVGAFKFHPFTSLKDSAGVETRGSLPSGHTTTAFAVAASLADDIHSTVLDIGLYTVAAGAGWSRIYDNRHWLTDAVLGAALGITTAKIVNGRWRLFGWRPPTFLVTPTGGAGIGWDVPL